MKPTALIQEYSKNEKKRKLHLETDIWAHLLTILDIDFKYPKIYREDSLKCSLTALFYFYITIPFIQTKK